ncbi:MAG TPA: 4Fe-4S dicluster-binding protein [Chitinophagales bacterium]|nr:4Fe-4S dicluster-binding protein [Chitinophagales bacterium]
MSQVNNSLSFANPHPANFNALQKIGLAIIAMGILAIAFAWLNITLVAPAIYLYLMLGSFAIGGGIFFYGLYYDSPEGIKNNRNYFSSLTSRGALGWIAGIVLTGFYICLYFKDYTDKILQGNSLGGLIAMFDPLSYLLRDKPSDQWFVYGSFYTLAVTVMGIKFIVKYRHNRYQQVRTVSVMFFQLIFAWMLPGILLRLYNYEPYWTYFFPLDYDALFPSNLSYIASNGALGQFTIFWGLILAFIATPILTYFIGKRWYCSWVCGCGGLAETAGDPFRHLSDKSLKAWKIERWLIHSVLAAIIIITILLLVDVSLQGHLLGDNLAKGLARGYGLAIGSIFSGVVGVGFYPILGNRVWCRFGCPMAAYLGIIQRFKSRFRITTNGAQCISCGNCSTYCEMGIDVRWYAQRHQNIVRASCVGCGVCSAVCPRGVLKLETGPETSKRTDIQMHAISFISVNEVDVLP